MCKVLRCQSPVTHVINVTKGDPIRPRVEVGFCDEHFNRVEAGEPYHVNGHLHLPALRAALDAHVAAQTAGTVHQDDNMIAA